MDVSILVGFALCLAKLPDWNTKVVYADRLSWKDYKNWQSKHYSPQEDAFRENIYNTYWEKIDITDAWIYYDSSVEQDEPYSLPLDEYADWTEEEKIRKHIGRYIEEDARDESASAVANGLCKAPTTSRTEFDWRAEGAVTDVKDEGQCKSSWAFSVTGALEGLHFRQTDKLVSLSEQNLIDCLHTRCHHFIDPQDAFKYLRDNNGIETEYAYPYLGHLGHNETCHFNPRRIGPKIKGFCQVKMGDEEALKNALVHYGPVSVTIDGKDLDLPLGQEIFYDADCSKIKRSRALLVVGYGTTDEGKDFWIVKNSEGTKWRDGGYIKMARNMNNMCGIATHALIPYY